MRFTTLFAVLALLAGGSGCSTEPALRITEIRVADEWDQWGTLEVEVHMFDVATREYLGCAGQGEGLAEVLNSDYTYRVDAHFREPYDDVELPPSILDNRMVELQVSEDDDIGCPSPPSVDDDMLGISGPVDRAMVEGGPMLSFGRASVRLTID